MIKVLKELVKRVENMHEKGGFQQRNVHLESKIILEYDMTMQRKGCKLKDSAIESIKDDISFLASLSNSWSSCS